MDWHLEYQELSAREREEFARITARLLAGTFLVKREESRRDFYFVERHAGIFQGYFKLMGWELVLDKVYGVIQAIGRHGGTRAHLRLWDTILLLVLRLLYEEKRRELQLSEDVLCRVQEIHDKCLALKLRERGVVEKKYLKDAFATFRRFSLVEVLGSDLTDPDCRFLIYPSILFAVQLDSVQELHARLEALGGGGEPEDDEVADGDQAG